MTYYMHSYEFELVYALPAGVVADDALLDRLYEAGCDDAGIGIGRTGQIAFEFGRAAGSLAEAMASARSDVEDTIPGVRLIEVGPDLVTIADIAALLGRSRQAVRQLMVSAGRSAPQPVRGGTWAVWHFAEVLAWLWDDKGQPIDPRMLEVACAAMDANAHAACARATEIAAGSEVRSA